MAHNDQAIDTDIIDLGAVTEETKGPGGPTGDSAGQLNLGGLTNE